MYRRDRCGMTIDAEYWNQTVSKELERVLCRLCDPVAEGGQVHLTFDITYEGPNDPPFKCVTFVDEGAE